MKHALFLLPFLALAAPAHAQVFVAGEGSAQSCYRSAQMGDQGSLGAIRTCTDALAEMIPASDKAATLVNRGVLQMRRGDYELAETDLSAALVKRPQLAEAHINHGAVLYYLGEDAKALTALNTAIDAGTEKEAIARFNRSLVHERMGNPKSAYYDLKRALELEPDWEQAQKSLSRFSVIRPGT